MDTLLRKFGFSEKESRLYIACLELGTPSAAAIIAKRAKLNRTTAYDVLKALQEKGLVIYHKKGGVHYYEARAPEKLEQYLLEESDRYKRLAKEAESIIPQLQARVQSSSNRPRIYFYEGDAGLIRVYEETLTATEEIRAYASDQANQDAIPHYFPHYYKRRTAKGIPIRALFPDTPRDRFRHKRDKQELRKSIILPKKVLNFSPEVNIFDNKIMIADWKEKLGIIIESAEIAQVFKQTFELAWEAAKRYNKEPL